MGQQPTMPMGGIGNLSMQPQPMPNIPEYARQYMDSVGGLPMQQPMGGPSQQPMQQPMQPYRDLPQQPMQPMGMPVSSMQQTGQPAPSMGMLANLSQMFNMAQRQNQPPSPATPLQNAATPLQQATPFQPGVMGPGYANGMPAPQQPPIMGQQQQQQQQQNMMPNAVPGRGPMPMPGGFM